MVSRWLWPGNRTLLEVSSIVVTWWIVFFFALWISWRIFVFWDMHASSTYESSNIHHYVDYIPALELLNYSRTLELSNYYPERHKAYKFQCKHLYCTYASYKSQNKHKYCLHRVFTSWMLQKEFPYYCYWCTCDMSVLHNEWEYTCW